MCRSKSVCTRMPQPPHLQMKSSPLTRDRHLHELFSRQPIKLFRGIHKNAHNVCQGSKILDFFKLLDDVLGGTQNMLTNIGGILRQFGSTLAAGGAKVRLGSTCTVTL